MARRNTSLDGLLDKLSMLRLPDCCADRVLRGPSSNQNRGTMHAFRLVKQKLLAPIALLMPLALAGCITPDKAMKTFLGQHSSELVARWGPPQHKMPDGQGGEIWVYTVHRQWTTPGQASTTVYGIGNTYGNIYDNPYGFSYQGNTSVYGYANTTWTPPQTQGYTSFRTFFINSDGIIYRYAWRGL